MQKTVNLLILIIFSAFFVTFTPSCSFTNYNDLKAGIITSGTISDKNISEASGIAVSRINEDVLWIINDSGNSPLIYGVNSKGDHIITITVENVINNDWEDLASFEYNGRYYILIADVGDNRSKRDEYYLHIIQEPDLNKSSNIDSISLKPSWTIPFTYEDGSRDCESVGVDVTNEKILLLSKRDRPPVLYELSLLRQTKAVAKRLGEIKALPKPTQNAIRLMKNMNYTTLPTAMDISKDGSYAVVLTYANAYFYKLENNSNWLTVFLTSPKEIILPVLQQAESICFSKDGASFFVTSEKIPAPLIKVDLEKHMNKKK